MNYEMLQLLVELENSFASFYGKLKALPRLKETQEALEYMEMHSYAHGMLLDEARIQYKEPKFKNQHVLDIQNNFNKAVAQKVLKEMDILEVLNILAGAEESIGMLYKSIASYLRTLATHYTDLADKIDSVAKEEFEHKDLLLKDRERLEQKLVNRKKS